MSCPFFCVPSQQFSFPVQQWICFSSVFLLLTDHFVAFQVSHQFQIQLDFTFCNLSVCDWKLFLFLFSHPLRIGFMFEFNSLFIQAGPQTPLLDLQLARFGSEVILQSLEVASRDITMVSRPRSCSSSLVCRKCGIHACAAGLL